MGSKFYFLIVIIFSFSMLSCGKDEQAKPADVKVMLKTFVKDIDAIEGEIKYSTEAGHNYSLHTLTYYLTRISLVEEDGAVFELKKAHLFDLQEEKTKYFIVEEVPAGHYKAVTFTFGLSKADNVFSFLPNTLSNANMAWPEQLGPGAFHYMKFEGNYDVNNTGTIKSFKYHLGPSMGEDYSFAVNKSIDLNINESTVQLNILMDIDQWLNGAIDFDFEVWGPGIMNKPDAQALAKGNGNGVFSITLE